MTERSGLISLYKDRIIIRGIYMDSLIVAIIVSGGVIYLLFKYGAPFFLKQENDNCDVSCGCGGMKRIPVKIRTRTK